MEQSGRYTTTARVLHWLLVLALLAQVGLGWYLGEIPRGTPARTLYVNFHKSTGLIIGLLIILRLYWRLTHPAPPLPGRLPAWERMAAKWSHAGLYACMIVMPLSGYVASNFSKYGVNFFNAIKLPAWGGDNPAIYKALNGAHLVTSFLFVGLIAVHALAALRHLFKRDGVFSRMWFGEQRSTDP